MRREVQRLNEWPQIEERSYMWVAAGGGRGKGSLVVVKIFSKKRNFSPNLANYFPSRWTLTVRGQFVVEVLHAMTLDLPRSLSSGQISFHTKLWRSADRPRCPPPFCWAVGKVSFSLAGPHFSMSSLSSLVSRGVLLEEEVLLKW